VLASLVLAVVSQAISQGIVLQTKLTTQEVEVGMVVFASVAGNQAICQEIVPQVELVMLEVKVVKLVPASPVARQVIYQGTAH